MEDRPVNRNKAGQFAKGHSGNPTGRGKDTDEARETKAILNAASPSAARKLVDLLDCKKEIIAFYAAQVILDRTLGKPIQAQEINVNGHLDVRGQVRALLQEKLRNERARTSEVDTK